MYEINNNFLDIVAGTSNKTSSAYLEASKNVSSASGDKGLGYIKNFIVSIENLSSKEGVRDAKITASKGNLKDYERYENIKTVIEFLKSNLPNSGTFKDVITIHDSLIKYQPQYTEGYKNNIRLVMLEYESGVYMLVTGLSMLMCNNIQVTSTGSKIKIEKANKDTFGSIGTTISDLAKQMGGKNHKDYLEAMNKARDAAKINTDDVSTAKNDTKEVKESVYIESAISDTFDIVSTVFTGGVKLVKFGITAVTSIKNSLFGIVPVIRSCMYLKYKKKADTIMNLEQQAQFIQNNINQLNARTDDGMDPKKKELIIRKQEAAIQKYTKKAEKLRAQLMETEKDASTAMQQENPSMGNTSDDDDFVLEAARISELFTESDNVNFYGKEKVQKIIKKIGTNSRNIEGIVWEIMTQNPMISSKKVSAFLTQEGFDIKNTNIDKMMENLSRDPYFTTYQF